MKNVFYATILCLASITFFTACTGGIKGKSVNDVDLATLDNKTEKCWEITSSAAGYSESYFEWGTEYEIVLILKEAQNIIGNLGTYSYRESSAKSEDACEAKNPDYEQECCWKITLSLQGIEAMTNYIWGSETEASEVVKMYEKTGYSVSLSKTSASDEDSCEAQNPY